ncbi:MAG: pentapeptide repeat-containing protein [Hyphomicrobiaceae bacterium]
MDSRHDATLSDEQPPPGHAQPADNGVETDGRDFTRALLDQAELAAANLSHATLNHASLVGADLTEANLSGASLRFATAPIAGLAAADLSRADLQLACFDQANLSAANLSGAVLDHADFFGANLANANLKGASLRFAALDEAKLDTADLSGADLRYARFNQADLTSANLSGSFLDYADFSGANLADANLCGAHLRYAKNLTPTQLEQARTSESTILPFHYLELAPLSQTRNHVRGRTLPLWVAGLFLIGMTGVLASLDLVRQPQRSTSHTTPTIAPAPNVTPILASLTPSTLLSGPRIETPAAARRIGPASLAALSLYPTVLTRKSDAMTSETRPSGLRPVPAQRLRVGDPARVLPPSLPEIVSPVDGPPERLALMTPSQGDSLSDAQPPVIAALPATVTIPAREEAPKGQAPVAPVNFDPLPLVVSLSQQKIDIYRGATRVTSAKISSGKRGHETRAGVFSILEKRRHHRSNLYSNAPMPWMQRMTWSGTALHGGVVPGYPASHGCIRLPFSFAPKLFKITSIGENVVVTHDRVTPKLTVHKNLFQPARAAPQVSMALADQDRLVTPDISATDATPQSPEQAEANAYDFADAVSTAPLRILITRRTRRDRIIGTQYVLASLGYLRRQNFTGRVGPETIAAIRAFQKANGLKVTGTFSEDVAKAVYQAAGKADPPPGHLFVRQDFRRVFDLPVDFRKPEQTLGTHVFTAMKFPPGNAKTPWMAIVLEGGDPLSVLDRIEIPDHVRKQISERLTPGSTLIIADASSHSAILREGDDFLVWSKEEPIAAVSDLPNTNAKPAKVTKAKRKQARPATVGKSRVQTRKAPPKRRSNPAGPYGGFWSFRRW